MPLTKNPDGSYPAPLPPDEAERIKALQDYQVLDSMPEQAFDDIMDGLDATREICRHPEERPRIIGMTASTFAEDRQACMDAGMDDYLAKPVRPADVAAALHRAARRP